jgi:hypothetical protein
MICNLAVLVTLAARHVKRWKTQHKPNTHALATLVFAANSRAANTSNIADPIHVKTLNLEQSRDRAGFDEDDLRKGEDRDASVKGTQTEFQSPSETTN